MDVRVSVEKFFQRLDKRGALCKNFGTCGGVFMNEREFEPLFVRPAEAARMLRISRAKAYALCASGDIPSTRIGKGSVRIPLEALRKLAAAVVKGGNNDGRVE